MGIDLNLEWRPGWPLASSGLQVGACEPCLPLNNPWTLSVQGLAIQPPINTHATSRWCWMVPQCTRIIWKWYEHISDVIALLSSNVGMSGVLPDTTQKWHKHVEAIISGWYQAHRGSVWSCFLSWGFGVGYCTGATQFRNSKLNCTLLVCDHPYSP